MKYFKRLMITLCTAFYFCLSSCNYLNVDEYFADTLGYDSIFQNKMNLQKYLWATAAFFPDEGAIWGGAYTPGVTGSDEAFVQWNTGEFPGVTFVLGHTTPDNLGTMNNWAQMYKIIRKVNIIFSRINECKDLTNIEQREILGYAHFMRGYAYYNLLQNFGPVVLVGDEPMNTNESPAYYNKERATYDESVDYICNELEIAANYIPLRVTVSQFGRPTRGAAYALIARLRLQQASPLFNGGSAAKTTFGGWIRKSDNVPYVSQTYDEYAGKRRSSPSSRRPSRDHPRVCGEKSVWHFQLRPVVGSPPRMRGKVLNEEETQQEIGITPAYAGKSSGPQARNRTKWDHPRVCGEKVSSATGTICAPGSPPRMRGKDVKQAIHMMMLRITPAYAGKRFPAFRMLLP